MTTSSRPGASMPMVKAMIVLDSEGKRIAVKYYTKEL